MPRMTGLIAVEGLSKVAKDAVHITPQSCATSAHGTPPHAPGQGCCGPSHDTHDPGAEAKDTRAAPLRNGLHKYPQVTISRFGEHDLLLGGRSAITIAGIVRDTERDTVVWCVARS